MTLPTLARRALVALGIPAVACSHAPATRHRAADHSAPAEDQTSTGSGVAPTTTEPAGPTTTDPPTTLLVTTTSPLVVTPTTVRVRATTTTLPERADEDMGDVEWAIRQAFPETPDKAVRVARCESGLDPRAVSPGGANVGLMQINVVHRGLAARMGYSWDQMLQVLPNLAVARAVYDRAGGWGPWSCA